MSSNDDTLVTPSNTPVSFAPGQHVEEVIMRVEELQRILDHTSNGKIADWAEAEPGYYQVITNRGRFLIVNHGDSSYPPRDFSEHLEAVYGPHRRQHKYKTASSNRDTRFVHQQGQFYSVWKLEE